ncbi:MAG: isochorismatase family protein [Desulfovibrionaceae bacterium]|nr:isochorismatase family protein [Desulfovibrionaceae bacterium]
MSLEVSCRAYGKGRNRNRNRGAIHVRCRACRHRRPERHVQDRRTGSFRGLARAPAIGWLIGSARAAGVPVRYVHHITTGAGTEFERGTSNRFIREEIAPSPGDTVSVKHSSDAFWDIDLEAALRRLGAKRLVFCGQQTPSAAWTPRCAAPRPTASTPCLWAARTPPATTAC